MTSPITSLRPVQPIAGLPAVQALPAGHPTTAPRVAEWAEAPLESLRGKGEARFLGTGGAPQLVRLSPFNPDGEPIVFIHGILGDPANQEALIRQAQREGKQVYVMAYDTMSHGASRNCVGFARELERLSASGVRKVTIVAHSLGGMTTKATLDRLTSPEGHIAAFDAIRFVGVGVPWGGVSAANVAVNVLTARAELDFARDLGPDSRFWSQVIATPFSKQVTFENVVGTSDQFQPLGWGSKTRDTNQATILKQAARSLVLPGEAHNTVLWHPDTLKFVTDPTSVPAPPTTRRYSPWRLFLKEMAANMNMPGAFLGGTARA